MNPLKRIMKGLNKSQGRTKKTGPVELLEIGDITEKLMIRLDKKIKMLKALEAQADEKIALLTNLISKETGLVRSEEVRAETPRNHRSEVQDLAGKGFKSDQIARILDLPSGEVELILNLVH